jgi:hypothetical protein
VLLGEQHDASEHQAIEREMVEALAARGVSAVARDDLRLTIPPGPDGIAQDAVVQAVLELDIELRRMERSQASLGDLFELETAAP